MLMRRYLRVCGLAGLLAAASGAAWAGDLKARLPQPTVGFLEFAGAAACAAAYETTPLAPMTNDPDMARLIESAWPVLSRFIVAEAGKEGNGAIAEAGLAVGHALWRQGFVLDWIELGMGPMGPAPALVFATEQGPAAEAFAQHVDTLLNQGDLPPATEVTVGGQTLMARQLPAPGMLLRYGVVDGVFIAMIGEQIPEQVLAALAGQGENLAHHPGLQAALAQIAAPGRQNVFLGFADVAGLLEQARAISTAMMGGDGFPPPVQQLIEELGLAGMTQATVCMQIADGGFRTTWRLGTQGDRKGMLKLAEQAALTDADVQWIPRDASIAVVANFDLPAAYDETLRVLGMLPMVPLPLLEMKLAEFKEMTGLDLRTDILESLADGWAFFDAPSSGGVLFTNFALVVEVKDEAAASALAKRGAEALVRLMQTESDGDLGGELLTSKRDGVEVSFLQFVGLPIPVAPAWAVHERRVVVGLTPQIVRSVVTRVKGGDARSASILENPNFVKPRQQLPESLIAITYVNTPAGMRQLIPLMSLGAIGATGMLRAQGVAVDADVVPDLAGALQGMCGSVRGAAITEDAIWQIGYGPTPVAVPEFGGGGVASTAMLTSILLPSLSRARTLAKRVASAANLRGLGTACQLYAFDHQGQYPPDFAALEGLGDLLENPSGPAGASYAYIPGHTTNSDPRWVVAYEDHHELTEGANVLFADGHVEFVRPVERVQALVAETKQAMAEKAKP